MVRRTGVVYLSLLAVLGALGCRSSEPKGPPVETVEPTDDDRPAVAQPSGPTAKEEVSMSELVSGNNAFAVDLYRNLSGQQGDLFLSSHSISVALAMTYAGARENTARQMAQVLHFEAPAASVAEGFARLDQAIEPAADAGYELHVANALWGMKGFAFVPAFLDTVRASYDATFKELDFGDEPAARQTINAWVEEQTRGKIKDLIPSGLLDALTRLVLTNAIYFKGAWAAEFDPKLTRDAPFTMLDGNRVNVPMMQRRAAIAYAETEGAQVVELPYKGEALRMVIMVPRQVDGLPALEASLSADSLTSTLATVQPREIELFLPRFKIEASFGLSDTLQAMGMTDAFSKSADLTGIGGEKGDLYISDVLHKAFVEVNEEGTEAAAATAVVVKARGAPVPPPQVRADHPFLFVIRHKATGAILFMGRLSKPAR